MNPPPDFSGGRNPQSPAKREVQLQGPRPAPLRVSKDSHKIRKPPPHPHLRAPPGSGEFSGDIPRQQPVIIYAVSPKVIHASVNDFMSIVQRLTGPSQAARASSGAGDLSPAARFASIEMTSPSAAERASASDLAEMFAGDGVEVGQFPGILSPAPASLPAIPPGVFSPASDPQSFFWANNSFVVSPSFSALFSNTPMVSPSLSTMDIFNLFDQ